MKHLMKIPTDHVLRDLQLIKHRLSNMSNDTNAELITIQVCVYVILMFQILICIIVNV